MLSSDENSGLFAFVFGLIVLVFAGIALSLVVDRRFNFSSSVKALEAEVGSNELELERLRELHRERSWSLTDNGPKRKMADATLADVKKRAAELMRHREALVSERQSLRDSIPALEERFATYRGKYRETARDAAVGEHLGTLTVPGGREYLEASISRVTDVGLEIRHAHGSARISATELGSAFQDRFQWDDEERRARLHEEQEASNALERMISGAKTPETRVPHLPVVSPDPEKVQMLRSKVIVWKSRVSQLKIERNRALTAAYGSQASPPGSLETWQAKAERLGGEIARAEGELTAAKAALAAVSPHDGLLRSHADGR